ncbi:hypothetical protein ABBQ32_009993 [Trebouxia sp. C0010 RCD-2024]
MSGSDEDAGQEQLQLLLAELKRIEGQQHQLKTAAAENKVLIVHPVKGFDLDEEDEYAEEVEVKPDPDKFVPSGGLTGFTVAKDLMKIDFSPPQEAPEEFRALTFSAPPMAKGQGRPALLASQIYHQGSFGAMDPASHDLYMFLEKLQEQQKEVVNLIKERQRIIAERDGTPIPAGPVFVPGGTTVPASIKAQSPATVKDRSPASMKTWAASPAVPGGGIPAVPSRLGALSAADRDAMMKKAKEAGMPRFNPAMAPDMGVMAMRMGAGGAAQGAAPAMQTGTTTGGMESRASAVTEAAGDAYRFGKTPSSAGPDKTAAAAKAKEEAEWRKPIPIDMQFGEGLKTRPPRNRPMRPTLRGWLIFLAYIASFAFYAYCRIAHTLDRHDPAFPYQIVFLVLELGTFISGVLFGLCHLCRLRPEKLEKVSDMAHRLRGTPDSTMGVEGTSLAKSVDKDGRPLPEGPVAAKHLKVTAPKPKKAAPMYIPQGPLKSKYHVQVLVYSGPESPADGERCKAALLAAHNMKLPLGPDGQRCTRIVYLVDPLRVPAKMELVRELSMDGILYMPGPEVVTETTDISRGASLNRVLRKIYPRGTDPKVTDLVAFLDDDQIAHPSFLRWTLPALEGKQVRLAHTRPAFENVSLHGDVFSQINRVEYESRIPGYEALGYCAPSSSAFVVRADALQKCNWLPMYTRAPHLALGQELKMQDYLSHFINEPLAIGIAPESIAQLYAAKRAEAQGHFQMYYHTRPAYALGELSIVMRLLYNAHAWSNQMVALLMPVWIGVPIIQIIFNVFPFNPNRWFGLGFVVYWCIGTPLLFRSYRFGRARAFWHYTTTQHNLWASYYLCLVRTWAGMLDRTATAVQDLPPNARRAKGDDVALSPKHKFGLTPSKLPDYEKGEGDTIPAGGAFNKDPDAPDALSEQVQKAGRHRRRNHVPWAALVGFVICAAFLGIGMKLLFGTNGSQSGARSAVTLRVLSRNLPFVVSLLWLLYHTVMFTIPLMWTFAFATARPGASPPAGAPGGLTVDTPTRRPNVSTPGPVGSPRTAPVVDSVAKGSLGCLGVYSYIAWAVCWAAALLVGIACLGLGDDSVGKQDMDYSALLSKSLQFYQAQQSGKLINNPIPWRGDSGLNDLPLGGWYEGGSNLKLTFPIAIAATQLAWGMIAAPGGLGGTRSTAAHVGSYAAEMGTWERPEDMTTSRANITISTTNTTATAAADLVGNAAAALAAASMVWESVDSAYAAQALLAAKDLYTFAQSVPGVYTQEYADAVLSYPSGSYLDDMAYAAAWMYHSTKDAAYLMDADSYYTSFLDSSSSIAAVNNWDNQFYATSLLLWQLTGNSKYENQLKLFLESWYSGKNGVEYLPSGIAWSSNNGGALRNTANAAFLALLYRQGGSSAHSVNKYACWAGRQVQYMAGVGTPQSFVVGFGDDYPMFPSHRGASCTSNCTGLLASSTAYLSSSINPHVLNGALVAGPGDGSYHDARTSSDNAVSIEYNSALSGALAILADGDWESCSQRNGLVD